MKNTGGYLYIGHYTNLDNNTIITYYQIDWCCPDCHKPNMANVKFGNGNHVLTCYNCKTKRIVTTIPRASK
jgi:hypothetical protein